MAVTASAQESGWQNNRHFRPVPAAHSFQSSNATSRSNTPTTQRPGWNLQWRTSPEIEARRARQISNVAFDEPIETESGFVGRNRPKSEPRPGFQQTNQLRDAAQPPVQRVAWMTQNTQSGGMSIPNNLFRDSTTSPSVPPNRSVEQIPTPPQQRRAIPRDLSDLFETDPPAVQSPEDTLPSPIDPQKSKPAGDASIRDLMELESSLESPAEDGIRSSDGFDDSDSSSDFDAFAPNPFGERSERDKQRAEDRKRREEEREARRAKQLDARSSIFGDDEGPASSGTGLSCDDFRDRIASATIDQVSLDISPPFRPDVIDEDEYTKLKGKFSGKQESRVWRSIDGRPLGTGRLADLAYEKEVITTEYGSNEELPLNRLSEADLAYISQNWGLPTECIIEQVAYTPRSWTPTTMTWTASNLCHKPLYFEEVNLERYGHTAGPFAQPIISSAHFFLNIAVLPYKMGVHSPHECQYALGYYRPGNCAPWIIPPIPLSVKGAWYQAAAISGTALLVP